MIRQLAFDLPGLPALGRADYCVSATNAVALAAVEGWRDWPQGKMVLAGPAGAGKTHLACIWAAATGAVMMDARALAQADIAALGAQAAVVVEDCDGLAGDAPGQEALFHLHNLLAAQGAPLLLTAATPPRDWGVTLPDLASRMQAAALTRLTAPDDALLSAVLIKLFSDRQITVAPVLISYLVARMDRSFEAARALVAALDAEALARGVAVTRQLAASLLDKG
ncbi:MAG: DnaA/Hda family protein [Paracoccaceae bacterium]|nr:DnaA/Hda family protein [Paracoccaceae bacterium]